MRNYLLPRANSKGIWSFLASIPTKKSLSLSTLSILSLSLIPFSDGSRRTSLHHEIWHTLPFPQLLLSLSLTKHTHQRQISLSLSLSLSHFLLLHECFQHLYTYVFETSSCTRLHTNQSLIFSQHPLSLTHTPTLIFSLSLSISLSHLYATPTHPSKPLPRSFLSLSLTFTLTLNASSFHLTVYTAHRPFFSLSLSSSSSRFPFFLSSFFHYKRYASSCYGTASPTASLNKLRPFNYIPFPG